MCIDEVDESSSAGSCGLDADGVVDGDIISDDDICDRTFVEAKFRNIAKMESALDTFGLMRRMLVPPAMLRSPMSLMAISEPDSEALPWLEDVLCGDRESLALGVGGTELGRGISSVDDPGKFNDFRLDVLFAAARHGRGMGWEQERYDQTENETKQTSN